MKRSVMLALGIAVGPVATAQAAGPWDGTYVFEQGLGKGPAANGDKLEVAFVSFKEGSMKNQFGKNEYTANQPLFTLTRKGNSIATTWQGYNKNEASTAGPPTFRKER